jgi:NAD(P)-dependent dehydrogenase (short-subunit alcohol dehydrogenase family)
MASSVSFDGRATIVTGAARGLGRAYARTLALHGARVLVNDIQGAEETAAAFRAEGLHAVADDHDISTDEGARGVVAAAVDAFDGLDAIVNNAGIAFQHPFAEMTWEMFDRTQRVNMYGPYFVTRYGWPHLVESGAGRVVMIASKTAIWGGSPHRTHYGTSKGAILAMTRQLAYAGLELGIGVNAVLPTAITRTGQPRESFLAQQLGLDPSADGEQLMEKSTSLAAAVVAWLCHPGCTSTGEFFNAAGGDTSRMSFAMGKGIKDVGLTVEKVRDEFTTVCDMTDATILTAMWQE